MPCDYSRVIFPVHLAREERYRKWKGKDIGGYVWFCDHSEGPFTFRQVKALVEESAGNAVRFHLCGDHGLSYALVTRPQTEKSV